MATTAMTGRQMLRNMFGVDLRSLALLRMGLAVCILRFLGMAVLHLRVFYTDDGVLPRSDLLTSADFPGCWCLWLVGGTVWFAAAMLAVSFVPVVMLLVGYRTRLAAIASFILLQSLQARNPVVLYGSDMVLRNMMFWALFLPLGERASVDAALGRIRPRADPTYLGVPSFAYLFQLVMIYLMSALLKSGDTWQVDYTAVYYALAVETYSRPLGHYLSQFDWLTHALTRITVYIEAYAPLFFILPVWSGWARLLIFVVLAGMQIGFNLCLTLGWFGIVMIVVTFILLPAEFWDRLAPAGARRAAAAFVAAGRRASERLGQSWGAWRRWWERARAAASLSAGAPRRAWWPLRALRDVVLLLLVVYVIFWNISTLPDKNAWLPDGISWIAETTGLDQIYNLFSPDPQQDDGWYVVEAELQNGRHVDIFSGADPVTFAKPASIADTYIDDQWRRYLMSLSQPECQPYLRPFAEYLGRHWNDAHSPAQQIKQFYIYFMHESPQLDHTTTPVEQIVLWRQWYTKDNLPPPDPAAPANSTISVPPANSTAPAKSTASPT